jgi:hypothetical protein
MRGGQPSEALLTLRGEQLARLALTLPAPRQRPRDAARPVLPVLDALLEPGEPITELAQKAGDRMGIQVERAFVKLAEHGRAVALKRLAHPGQSRQLGALDVDLDERGNRCSGSDVVVDALRPHGHASLAEPAVLAGGTDFERRLPGAVTDRGLDDLDLHETVGGDVMPEELRVVGKRLVCAYAAFLAHEARPDEGEVADVGPEVVEHPTALQVLGDELLDLLLRGAEQIRRAAVAHVHPQARRRTARDLVLAGPHDAADPPQESGRAGVPRRHALDARDDRRRHAAEESVGEPTETLHGPAVSRVRIVRASPSNFRRTAGLPGFVAR